MSPVAVDTNAPPALDLARCLGCHSALCGRKACYDCGRSCPLMGSILSAIGALSGNNRIAASFYDGPGWRRFRPWERLFLRLVGGPRKARGEILKFLPASPGDCILEVGIGDGDNIPYLPPGPSLYGVDISRVQLEACLARFPDMAGRLAWSEAEALPFPDDTFDASYSIGGFNYFSDPEAALREMRRVTRPGGVMVVADERPDLKRFGLGNLLGWKAYDAWWMRRVGLPDDFIATIQATEIDPSDLASRAVPGALRVAIWKKLGYCLVDPDPSRRPPA